mmetsp:Transcript_18721/g.32509  ORF Transcript_18721/g.32509 Transcript_18721/m.32509 type:complete len:366 (-) Transcript_18721:76-1173(-)
MFRTNSRVIQTGGDRMCFQNLAILVLQLVAHGAVQNTHLAVCQSGCVAGGVYTFTSSFYTDQLDRRLVAELVENTHGIGTATDTGNYIVRKPAPFLHGLLSRLQTDDLLEVANQHGVRMGTGDRTHDVVSLDGVAHPVTNGFGQGIGQRRGTRGDRSHLSTHEPHTEHIELLSLHILGTHVHNALHAESRAHGGGGHAVLSRAGLGNNAGLAHTPCEQNLGEGVVDLVSTSMVQILALQINLGPRSILSRISLCQPLRKVQRRWSTNIILQQSIQFIPECRIFLDLHVRTVELLQGNHERLGDIHPTKLAESALLVWRVRVVHLSGCVLFGHHHDGLHRFPHRHDRFLGLGVGQLGAPIRVPQCG